MNNEYDTIIFDDYSLKVKNENTEEDFDDEDELLDEEEEYELFLQSEYVNIYSDLHNWDYYRFKNYRHEPEFWCPPYEEVQSDEE